MGTIVSVNIARTTLPRPSRTKRSTGIDKRPVVGPVQITLTGADGDHIGDAVMHGGPDKALYAYAIEDYRRWQQRLGRTLRAGQFGENLTLSGIDVSSAVIGERWALSSGPDSVVVEVTQPRTPCGTFKWWMDERLWGWRFTLARMPGAYLRVVQPGVVRAGSRVHVLTRPAHGVQVRECGVDAEPEVMRRLRDSGQRLPESLRFTVDRVLARGRRLRPGQGPLTVDDP